MNAVDIYDHIVAIDPDHLNRVPHRDGREKIRVQVRFSLEMKTLFLFPCVDRVCARPCLNWDIQLFCCINDRYALVTCRNGLLIPSVPDPNICLFLASPGICVLLDGLAV